MKNGGKKHSLEDLYLDQLRDLHDAEKQILKALPKMIKMASSPELKEAFEEHLEVSKEHVERLKQIFTECGEKPGTETCKGMAGIIGEGEKEAKKNEDAEPSVLDAVLIAGAQRVEHYEIAGYGTACAFARQIGDQMGMDLLKKTLEEEKKTDKELTELAESEINVEAAAGAGSEA